MLAATWSIALTLLAAGGPRADTGPSALARAHAHVDAAIDPRDWGERRARRLSDAGLEESLAIAAVDESLACDCDAELREHLLEWLRHEGTARALPVLMRAAARHAWPAARAIEAILRERMLAELGPCAPPTARRVAAVRDTLDDFAVVDRVAADGGRWVARALTDAERDDLAYFLVAVEHVGPAIGEVGRSVRGGPATPESAAATKARERALAEIEAAKRDGDARALRRAATRYLEGLGFPDAIDPTREQQWAWGGARFSYVARDLAAAAEILGEHELALGLYRDTNPGGGACGTSVDVRRGDQLRGFIRTAEALGRCELTIAERMMNWDGDEEASAYGPARLVDAGFDLARLYRGALLTRHRDLEPSALEAVLAGAPGGLADAAVERLRRRGPEAWEARTWAVEGLAAEFGRPEIPTLLDLLPHADPRLAARIVRSVGELEERHQLGPCDDTGWWGLRGSSSHWTRPVPAIAKGCATQLADRDADALALRVLPLLHAPDLRLAAATAETLGALAAPVAQAPMRRRARQLARELERCGDDCDDVRALDEHLRGALARHRELRERARESLKADARPRAGR